MDEYNNKRILALPQELVSIPAIDKCRNDATGNVEILKSPKFDRYASLLRYLNLKVSARIMLIKNIDTEDGLVNGALGSIVNIDSTSNGRVNVIYVVFDNENVGKNVNSRLGLEPQVGIPLQRCEETLNKGGARKQFPIKLAWACTVHKMQGLTVKNAVVSFKRTFRPGQMYVALSKLSSLSGLIIQDFNVDCLYCDEDIEDALHNMPNFIELAPTNFIETSHSGITIASINIQGLHSHMDDLSYDDRIMGCDIICLCETDVKYDIPVPAGYQFYNKTREICYTYRNKTFTTLKGSKSGGVGILVKNSLAINKLGLELKDIEYIAIVLPETNIAIVNIYKSPSHPMKIFLRSLNIFLEKFSQMTYSFIAMGDFNEDLLKGDFQIKNTFEKYNFKQMVNQPTTDKGTLLDHVYVSSEISNVIIEKILPLYYSYHSAIVVRIT